MQMIERTRTGVFTVSLCQEIVAIASTTGIREWQTLIAFAAVGEPGQLSRPCTKHQLLITSFS